MAAGEVAADELEQLVVVEQAVELLQLGLETQAELGDQGEEAGPVVSIPEHGSSPPSVRSNRFLSVPPAYKRPWTRAISHRKLVLQW